MIGLTVTGGYLVMSALVARALLRTIMTRPVCGECREGWFAGRCYGSHWSVFDKRPLPAWVPLGEVTERPLGIAAVAVLGGLAWPFTGLMLLAMRAPRTPGELHRLTNEQADRIAELERELEARHE